ncbi:MAG: hypothetical protein Q8M92_06860 [Candidatus Subteraquimicrobiales bacterium]|nr:hypothetical protein [Candidatus Subteraquimicrobiales bacterium]
MKASSKLCNRNEYLNNRRMFYEFIETSQINNYTNWLDKSKNRIVDQINKKPSSRIFPKTKIANEILPKYLKIDTLLAVGQYHEVTDRINNNKNTDTSKDISYWNQEPEFYIKQGKLFFKQKFYNVALRCFELALVKQHDNKIASSYRNRCLEKI